MEKIKVTMITEGEGILKFFCPGCFQKHVLEMPPYSFSGTTEKPTLNKPYLFMDKRRRVICAATIEDGNIEFSTACEHFMAGKKEELPDFI